MEARDGEPPRPGAPRSDPALDHLHRGVHVDEVHQGPEHRDGATARTPLRAAGSPEPVPGAAAPRPGARSERRPDLGKEVRPHGEDVPSRPAGRSAASEDAGPRPTQRSRDLEERVRAERLETGEGGTRAVGARARIRLDHDQVRANGLDPARGPGQYGGLVPLGVDLEEPRARRRETGQDLVSARHHHLRGRPASRGASRQVPAPGPTAIPAERRATVPVGEGERHHRDVRGPGLANGLGESIGEERVRLDRDDAPVRADEARGEQGVLAMVRPDVHDRVPLADQPREEEGEPRIVGPREPQRAPVVVPEIAEDATAVPEVGDLDAALPSPRAEGGVVDESVLPAGQGQAPNETPERPRPQARRTRVVPRGHARRMRERVREHGCTHRGSSRP